MNARQPRRAGWLTADGPLCGSCGRGQSTVPLTREAVRNREHPNRCTACGNRLVKIRRRHARRRRFINVPAFARKGSGA